MKMRQYVLGLAVALVGLPAMSAGIDGRWNASVDGGPAGPIELVFDLKAEGEKLTGNMTMAMMPAPTPLSDGVIKGDEVSFKVSISMMEGMAPLVISYQGKLKGDELNLRSVLDMGQGPTETPLVAKRVM